MVAPHECEFVCFPPTPLFMQKPIQANNKEAICITDPEYW